MAARRRTGRRIRAGRRGRYPTAIEKRYAKLLARRVDTVSTLVAQKMPTDLTQSRDGAQGRAALRRDNSAAAMLLLDFFTDLGVVLTTTLPPDAEAIGRLGRDVERFTKKDTIRQVEIVADESRRAELLAALRLAPGADALVGDWAATALEKMRGLDQAFLGELQEHLVAAVEGGGSREDLAAAIQERTGISRRRAQLSARDQVGTLNAQITRHQQVSLGVSHFRWSSSGDGRVRSRHESLDGRIFSWADGAPGEGRPGEPVLCRCAAIPVL